MGPKTNKELNDNVASVEKSLENTLLKVESFEERIANNCSLSQSILQSIKNIDTRLDGISTDVLQKLDDNSDSLAEKIATTTNSIKNDIAEIRSVVISKLQADNRKLRSRVAFLEDRFIMNEKNQNQHDQHGRKIYFEVSGIPETITQADLKPTLVSIFKGAGINDASIGDIEVTHRLKSQVIPKPIIVKAKRDFIEKVFGKKKVILQVGRNQDLNFGDNNKLYINEHLSPSFKSLRYNCKLMKNEEVIDDYWFSNSKLKVKSNGQTIIIDHEIDLYRINPMFEFTFDTSLYQSIDENDMDRMDDAEGND